MTAGKRVFYQLAGTRRSIRRFDSRPIPERLIRRVVGAALRAPSAHNRQPWRFAIVQKGAGRDDLVDAMAERFHKDLMGDGLAEEDVERRVNLSRERLRSAPLVVVVCMTMEDMDTYADVRRQEAERTMAVQSVALAAGQLLLAAHAEGLGGCWMCAPLFAPAEVREALGLPATWEPQGLLALGYPAEPGRETSRRQLDDVAVWR